MDKNNSQACIAVVTFLYTEDEVMLTVKNGLAKLMEPIPDSKIELRLVEAKGNIHVNGG